ncbi:uncharacterized protein PAC_02398 [Phialocephala subalpina]|uniref:Uncharacterized protein n=1 Tax=Phialocephala subalpina TaxID=576137 RepID=A0A1L7WIC6_9HELO|nr:uncharacterized protein PAC_02398 [Phialocephala subalpina]
MEETILLRGHVSQDSSRDNELEGSLLSPNSYTEVKLDDTHISHQFTLRWQYRLIFFVIITILVVFGGGSILTRFTSPPHPPAPFTDLGRCGETPDAARANGCVFDLMMSGWVHPPCYDKELSDKFLSENNWTFYREREAINVIPEEEARLGNYKQIYTLGNFHYQHCGYIWAKQMQAATRFPLVLDSASRSVEHTEHCIQRVGDPNVTQVPKSTGTKITMSSWKIRCMIGHGYVP